MRLVWPVTGAARGACFTASLAALGVIADRAVAMAAVAATSTASVTRRLGCPGARQPAVRVGQGRASERRRRTRGEADQGAAARRSDLADPAARRSRARDRSRRHQASRLDLVAFRIDADAASDDVDAVDQAPLPLSDGQTRRTTDVCVHASGQSLRIQPNRPVAAPPALHAAISPEPPCRARRPARSTSPRPRAPGRRRGRR